MLEPGDLRAGFWSPDGCIVVPTSLLDSRTIFAQNHLVNAEVLNVANEIAEVRLCKRCGVPHPLAAFVVDKSRRSGRHPYCAGCKSKYLRDWRINNLNRSRSTNKRSHLKTKYGVSVEEFNSALAAQEGACAICQDILSSPLHTCVDHDHRTGAVRGILCRKCNTGIGQFRDRPDLLERAITYLRAPR